MAVAKASKDSPSEAEERLLIDAAQKDPVHFIDLYEKSFTSRLRFCRTDAVE
jgi:hypothetical protein